MKINIAPLEETIAMASHNQGVCFKLVDCVTDHILGVSASNFFLNDHLRKRLGLEVKQGGTTGSQVEELGLLLR